MVAAVAVVAGCGTHVTGTAVTAPVDPSAPVDPTLLDTANYPTVPVRLGPAGTPGIGAILDGQRMLNFVPGPWDADPSLIEGGALSPQVTARASGLSLRVGDHVIAIADRLKLVNAVYTSRSSENKTINHTVLRFPDPPTAAAAATEMADGSLRALVFKERVDRVPVPGHPEALAVGALNTTGGANPPPHIVAVYTAHGPYVFHEEIVAESREVATQLAGRMLDLQIPLIDQFQPTNPADFASIPRDPTGLLSRTLPLDDKDSPTTKGVYERSGTLHFQTDPVRSAALFDRAGLKALARANGTVYEAAHPAGATAIMEDFADEVTSDYAPAAGVPNLNASRCFQLKAADNGPVQLSAGAYCVATADQYVIEAQGSQLQDLHHRVAAQYVMLTAG
ncbi:hypothetical protein [Mycolicibacterium iranicum]|uniref:DUF7373 family lipoprotein n=1 Tax=Mycolicibacterium iranicum TaxID=912594 RepID=UPI001622D796|nr:hypothetical protein [Mycolicibacterium iranicum]